jgi:hypothetical protein
MRQEHVKETVATEPSREIEHPVGHIEDEPTSGIHGEAFRLHRHYLRAAI